MTQPYPDSVLAVQRALEAHDVAAEVAVLPQSTRTAVDAAGALGCEVDQIAKSLVFRRADTGDPLLVVACGGKRVDEGRVAETIGATIGKADADMVRARTGFAIGGVPPLGHSEPIVTLFDERLLRFQVIWAAAGTANAVFRASPRQLTEATGAAITAV